jgi:ribosome-binding ATPase YchF (GTP1/OBG family)
MSSVLAAMSPEERVEFCREMQVQPADRDQLICRIMHTSGQMIFFTAGEKEVRTWLLRENGTAVEAAAGIHTDLAKGFIRAETMTVADLVRLGSEREIKAAGLARQEPKDYVIQDGDIILIKHN